MKFAKFAMTALVVPATLCLAQEETAAEAVEAAAEEVVAVAEIAVAETVAAVEAVEAVIEEVEIAETEIEEADEAADEYACGHVPYDPIVNAQFTVASGSLTDSAGKLSKHAVMTAEVEVEAERFGPVSVFLGAWANYDLCKGKKNGAIRHHCFTEIDLWARNSVDIGDCLSLDVNFLSCQYPNMGLKGEEKIALNLYSEFCGLKAGLEFEYILTGADDNDMEIRPYLTYGMTLCEKSGAGFELGVKPVYVIQEGGIDAWTACVLSAQIDFGPFFAFGKYYAQMCDKIYTDEKYHDINHVYGIGYRTSF